MPKLLSSMRVADPFVMNEDKVNDYVWEFLKEKGFSSPPPLKGRQKGIDVQGEKFGRRIYVESKGSHANTHDQNTVFGTKQIKTHSYMQVGKLMEYRALKDEKGLFVMANPDIPRIRERLGRINSSLDDLGFIRFWVQRDGEIKIEYPGYLEKTLAELEVI